MPRDSGSKAPAPPAPELWPIEDLAPYERNSRLHSAEQIDQLAHSLEEFGMVGAIVIRKGIIGKGHGTLAGARKLIESGLDLYPAPGKKGGAKPYPPGQVPVLRVDGWSDAQFRAFVIADNKLALNAGWNEDLLAIEIADLDRDGFEIAILGFDEDELADLGLGQEAGSAGNGGGAGSLSDRFLIPPFSVLNAREGWWQERKREWLALGIQSEIGRGENLLKMSDTILEPDAKKRAKAKRGKTFGDAGEWADRAGTSGNTSTTPGAGTSIFDPVLCELAYRWFSPKGGLILDPFAGGSVRGIVAAKLGREYIGCELRGEQCEANRDQAAQICGDGIAPAWIEGDSRQIDRSCAEIEADFIFSCPPYADLERYSDDPADLSTLDYAEFIEAYREIIAKACARLKPDRFAAFIVGDIRDRDGNYRDFVGDTVQAFRDAGLSFYNEAILITPCGSLAIRAGKQFSASRKFGKSHQNCLFFLKGNAKRAVAALGKVNVEECLKEAEAAAELEPSA